MKENPVVKNLKCVVGSGKGKEDLANSLLQFAKSHMESMNQQTGGAMYRKELEDVDRYMKDPNAPMSRWLRKGTMRILTR